MSSALDELRDLDVPLVLYVGEALPRAAGLPSRRELVDGYITQWLIGGVFLILCAGVTRVRIDQGAGLRLLDTGVPDQVVVAAIMYFLTGLLLISQARLAQMRALWYFDGVQAPPSLPARWRSPRSMA